MRTPVKHIVPMLAQFLQLFRADVIVEPTTEPHQVTATCPTGQARPPILGAPNIAPSIWQLDAYIR